MTQFRYPNSNKILVITSDLTMKYQQLNSEFLKIIPLLQPSSQSRTSMFNLLVQNFHSSSETRNTLRRIFFQNYIEQWT